MSENEYVEEIDQDIELEDEPTEDNQEPNEQPEVTKDKPKETLEQKEIRLERQLARIKKQRGEPVEKKETSSLDYGQKAFLVAHKVSSKEEQALALEFMKNTGKDLDDVVENKYFQAELKELRESKAEANARPDGSKRSGYSPKTSVDYWVAKGELPPNTPENQALRREVVNTRYKNETSGSKFSTSSGSIKLQSQL